MSDLLKNILWRVRNHPSSERHVFVMGAPRSGTTLMQVIVSAHSAFVGCEAETGLFTWQNLFDRNRRYCGLPEAEIDSLMDQSGSVVEFLDGIARYFRAASGARYFVEKTPQHVLRLSRLCSLFPESSFINLYRDGRDCFCSAKRHPDIPQRNSVEVFARYWKKCVQSRLAVHDGRIMDVRYEDLGTEPEATIVKVMRFLDSELEQEQLQPDNTGRDKRARLDEFSRLQGPIDGSSNGRWRTEMDDREKQVFWQLAGNELKTLGYAEN